MSSSAPLISVFKWNDVWCLLVFVCCVTQNARAFSLDTQRELSMQTPSRHAGLLHHMSRRDKLMLTKLLQRLNGLPLSALVTSNDDDAEVFGPSALLETPPLLDTEFHSGVDDSDLLVRSSGSATGRSQGVDPSRLYALAHDSDNSNTPLSASDVYAAQGGRWESPLRSSLVDPEADGVMTSKRMTPSYGVLSQLLLGNGQARARIHQMSKKAQPCFYNVITCY